MIRQMLRHPIIRLQNKSTRLRPTAAVRLIYSHFRSAWSVHLAVGVNQIVSRVTVVEQVEIFLICLLIQILQPTSVMLFSRRGNWLRLPQQQHVLLLYRVSFPASYQMCAIHLTSVCGRGTFSGVAAGLTVASDSKHTLRFFTTAYRDKHVMTTNLLLKTVTHMNMTFNTHLRQRLLSRCWWVSRV